MTFLFRQKPLRIFVRAALASLAAADASHAAPAVCIVDSNTDDAATAATTVIGATTSGTLRDCILANNLLTGSTGAPTAGMTITFSPAAFTGGAANVIALADSLPLIFNNATIDASALAQPVVIDGGGAHRIFFVSGLPDSTQNYNATGLPNPDGAQSIGVLLGNLELRNGKASGGNGGGGGLGAGGALFVNKNAAVTLKDVGFSGNTAAGGMGADAAAFAGGGGMGGNGHYGGGGLTGHGSYSGGGIGTDAVGGTLFGLEQYGGGFGGTGLGQISAAQNFGAAFGGGVYGTSGAKLGPHAGGIGGGGSVLANGGFGGGGGFGNTTVLDVGAGGFGGGGGVNHDAVGFGGGGGSGSSGKNANPLDLTGYAYNGHPGERGRNGAFGGGGAGGGGGGGCYNGVGDTGVPGAGGLGGAGGPGAGGGADGNPGNPCPDYMKTSAGGASGAGGGGAGLGGAVFVRSGGTLAIQGGAGRSLAANVVAGGPGYQSGAAAGSGLFAMSGTTVMVDIAGEYRIDDDIGDDSPLTLPAGHGYTPGSGGGAALFKLGVGTLYFDGIGTFAGATGVLGGTFGGTGVVAGPVLVDSGAAIAPGDPAANGGVGTLVLGPLTWTSGSAMQFQLGATQSGSDALVVLGPLQKSGAGNYTFHIGMGNRPPVAGTVYALIQSTNAGAFSPADFSYDFDATYSALSGHFGIVNNVVAFQVDTVASDRIFASGF